MRVRIKLHSPLREYSFHHLVAGNEYDAHLTDTGMYAVNVGALSAKSDQAVWAFDPREVEVIK